MTRGRKVANILADEVAGLFVLLLWLSVACTRAEPDTASSGSSTNADTNRHRSTPTAFFATTTMPLQVKQQDPIESKLQQQQQQQQQQQTMSLFSMATTNSPPIGKCLKQKYKACEHVPIECMRCSIDRNRSAADCVYGQPMYTNCTVHNFTECQGARSFVLEGVCRFCYQAPDYMHMCTPMTSCRRDSHQRLYRVNCTVEDHVVCLGSRAFYKRVECNWTSGYKWRMTLTLSVFLGGFGMDRFYLGQYREGLGKLFSFGGLGVWTLIDVLLIYVGYIGPEDGSIYI